MKSWKTTLGGSLAATGVFLAGGPMALSACNVKLPDGLFAKLLIAGFLLQAAGVLVNGLFARDNNVPSEAVPKAADRAAEIKRDTEILLKP